MAVAGTTPELVGRASELRDLEGRLSLAERGVGGLVLLAGEAGIGKSAVAERAALGARRRGFEVAWSACWETAAVPPLRPWVQLLDQLARPDASPPDLTATAGDHDSSRVEQADRVVGWLRQRATVPLLLVMDDLHWADAATVSVLAQVASVLATMPVVIVAAHRTAEADAAAALHGAIADLRRHGLTLELSGLDVEGTAALVAAVRGHPVSDAASRSLLAMTGGNPLFVRELSRALPAATFAGAIDANDVAVPATLRSLVVDRRSALSRETQEVVDVLSVAGDEADLRLLAAVCEQATEDVLALVDEASRAGLVHVHGSAVSFRHAVFRAAVYDSLSSAVRAGAHDRVGRELEARRQRGLHVGTAALAHHFGRAAPLGNTARAFGYAMEAAAEAISLLSFDVAARRFEQALAMLAIDPGLGDRTSLTLDLADALMASGDVAKARKVFREVAEDAARDGADRALGRAALGFAGGIGGMEVVIGDAEVCDLLERAADALAGDGVLGARVAARLATALSYLTPLARRAELASAARERAVAGGDPVAIAETLAAWCDVVAGPDRVVERRDAATEIVERAVHIGDASVEALGWRLLVEALFELGELRQAEAAMARSERTAARLGRAEYAWYPSLWRGALALARGQMEAHARARSRLEVLVRDAGGTNAELLAKVQLGAMAFDLADPALAQETLGEVLAMGVVDDVQLRTTATLIRCLAGDLDGARTAVDQCVEAALAAALDSEWPAMMMQLAEVIVAVGGHPAAEAVHRAIEPYGHVWVVEGIGAAIRGPLDRVLGSLVALLGDREAAEARFAAAHEAATRAGATLLAAVVDHDAGRALGDRARLEQAAAVWRRVGATYRLAEIDEVTGSTCVAQPLVYVPANGIVRRGDVWSITFEGRTCTLPDRKGLRDLARLLAEPGRAIAALDLMAPGATVTEGSTGSVIDAQARDAYRRRLAEIEAELDDADETGDAVRSARLAAEGQALIGELRAAHGLGGRLRAAGGTAERARTAVRSRIRDALERIRVADPALGRHLAQSVRTGTYCVYQPDPPVDWVADESSHIV